MLEIHVLELNKGLTGQVQETDLCVLIGNLLENAVAACQEPPLFMPFVSSHSVISSGKSLPPE
ncbi:MAG TPA: hypothetical protein DD414_04060 [Lachnospiraceae bacterium]|nr:hypothetical protein [Lachnospiraceae bacterium]